MRTVHFSLGGRWELEGEPCGHQCFDAAAAGRRRLAVGPERRSFDGISGRHAHGGSGTVHRTHLRGEQCCLLASPVSALRPPPPPPPPADYPLKPVCVCRCGLLSHISSCTGAYLHIWPLCWAASTRNRPFVMTLSLFEISQLAFA